MLKEKKIISLYYLLLHYNIKVKRFSSLKLLMKLGFELTKLGFEFMKYIFYILYSFIFVSIFKKLIK